MKNKLIVGSLWMVLVLVLMVMKAESTLALIIFGALAYNAIYMMKLSFQKTTEDKDESWRVCIAVILLGISLTSHNLATIAINTLYSIPDVVGGLAYLIVYIVVKGLRYAIFGF